MSRLEKNPGEGRENRQEGFAVNQGKKLRAITKAEGMKRKRQIQGDKEDSRTCWLDVRMARKEFKTFSKFLMTLWMLSIPCVKGHRRKAVLKER